MKKDWAGKEVSFPLAQIFPSFREGQDSPIISTHGAIRGQQTQHQTSHPSISRVGNLPG